MFDSRSACPPRQADFYRRYAYWEPFPIYFPRIHRHHVYWNRIPWFFF